MPQVEPTEITSEESQQQLDAQESLQSNLLDKIKDGNVFKSLSEDLPQQDVESRDNAQPVQDEEQVQEEPQQEESQDDITEEEVVPKSKIQPRIDQMRAQITRLEQKLAERESSVPADDVQRQLDAMSEEVLEDTLIRTRILKEQTRDNPEQLAEYVKLERRIEKQIATAPQKFVQGQVSEANKTINHLASEGEITESNFPKIQEIAKNIYASKPRLQKMIDGQAMAIELAVDHYKALGKVNSVAVNTQNLKSQVNTLKKKTALDTKGIKSGGEKVNLDKLRSNALNGTMKDKERFAQSDSRFRIDSMIPDFLKGK